MTHPESESEPFVDIVIVGAGPAGASLAYLLARQGLSVTLLERRTDFGREFRGEVLMPTGLDALSEMGVGAELLQVPGHTMESVLLSLNGQVLADIALDQLASPVSIRAISQPALLEMLVAKASACANFHFIRGASVKELMRNAGGRITGVRYAQKGQTEELRATLVVGADGRNSAVRKFSGIANLHASPPMDIVWCKVPCPATWQGVGAYAGRGNLLVAYRTWGNMLQIGWVILKGTFGDLRERGMPEWVDMMAEHVSTDLGQHLLAHRDNVEKPFLLDVVSDCVEHWSVPGALLIGDAAHTMSPVGGQGINLALRDAIVTANRLAPLFLREQGAAHLLIDGALKTIERERMPEIEPIQRLQAAPPRLILSRAWWGEPLRWLACRMLRLPSLQSRMVSRIRSFLFGVTDVAVELSPSTNSPQ